MKKLSIVGEILNSHSVSITDENNIPVTICPKTNFKFNYGFISKPFIIIDNFEKRMYKDIEIKTIDVDYLNKFGYRLVSLSLKGTSGSKRNFRGQKNCYTIEEINSPIPNAIILSNVPKDHYIEYDITNSRIRLRGRGVYPYNKAENASPWIKVIKK